jgi:acetoin utilization protein AcuB
MTSPVKTIRAKDPVSRAEAIMLANRFHQLPVVDNAGLLCGIVSDRDCRSAPRERNWKEQHQASEIMSSDPTTVSTVDLIEEAAARLFYKRYGALPVLDERNKLAGIITRTDILRLLMVILGMDQPGARLEVQADTNPQNFRDLFALLEPLKIPVVSVVLTHAPGDSRRRTLYLRLAATDTSEACKALEDGGFKAASL